MLLKFTPTPGELSQPAVEEMAEILSNIWVDGGGADLARFIKMKRTGGEYMLYAYWPGWRLCARDGF